MHISHVFLQAIACVVLSNTCTAVRPVELHLCERKCKYDARIDCMGVMAMHALHLEHVISELPDVNRYSYLRFVVQGQSYAQSYGKDTMRKRTAHIKHA